MLANIRSECYNKKYFEQKRWFDHKQYSDQEKEVDHKVRFWKRKDLLLALAVLLLALLLLLFQYFTAADGGSVVVSVDRQVQAIYSLEQDHRVSISGNGGGTNLLVIEGNQAYVEEADCPDGLCIRQGAVSRSGESIICLPHKVSILILSDRKSDLDTIAQ